ncbi:hypothetical protein Tco_0631906 [Tanacetum coccineum]
MEVTASLNNPTSGRTKVIDTTNDMNNSAARNWTSNVTDRTSNVTVGPDVVRNLIHSGEKVGNELVNEFPSSYATKLTPTTSTKANLLKHEANVPNDADYDVWLPLASVHEVNDRMKNSLYGNLLFFG